MGFQQMQIGRRPVGCILGVSDWLCISVGSFAMSKHMFLGQVSVRGCNVICHLILSDAW
jgi:hypothetical protein